MNSCDCLGELFDGCVRVSMVSVTVNVIGGKKSVVEGMDEGVVSTGEAKVIT